MGKPRAHCSPRLDRVCKVYASSVPRLQAAAHHGSPVTNTGACCRRSPRQWRRNTLSKQSLGGGGNAIDHKQCLPPPPFKPPSPQSRSGTTAPRSSMGKPRTRSPVAPGTFAARFRCQVARIMAPDLTHLRWEKMCAILRFC